MRLGVLDVGSNTVHLQVVDAHRGAHPTPMSSTKSTLRLIEQIDAEGRLTRDGVDRLIAAVAQAVKVAEASDCEEVMAFATSAVRDASNCVKVLATVQAETGIALQVLSGTDEARLTFLAVRRWCGWSAGRILGLDIGGGSLELAVGNDEEPDLALSLPLGAGRLTLDRLTQDPPTRDELAKLREWLAAELRVPVRELVAQGRPDRVVATSKTFRSLARLTGAAPSGAGPLVRRT
ncbi:MAG: Ppx/GppA phosphatase family protein, partial [Mycobacteriaceae bacterium]